MEFLFELLFEIVGEFVLELLFEGLAEFGLHAFRKRTERKPPNLIVAIIGYGLAGAAAGALSLWLFPTFFVASQVGRVISLLVTPLAAGAAIALLGAWRRKRGEELVRLDKFAFGYFFALTMAAVRFAFGQVGGI